jgi:thiopurine S-methyltransferase
VWGVQRSFWKERWSDGRIGFHRTDPHPALGKHWQALRSWLDRGNVQPSRVLVPLCGKSLDLAWLAERSELVSGVEFVERAARDYFAERGVQPTVEPGPPLTLRHERTSIVVSDFFTLEQQDVGEVNLAYDRAALVAVAPERRPEYLTRLWHLLGPQAGVLLISFEHDLGSGPPFSVDEGEGLFERCHEMGATFRHQLVESHDVLETESRFRERGATFVRELVWFLQKAD